MNSSDWKESLRGKLAENGGKPNLPRPQKSTFESFCAGAVSGTVSTLLLQPLDMLKTRVQQAKATASISLGGRPPANRLTLPQHCARIVQLEGVGAFWNGLTPALVRTVPGVGLYFASLHTLQSLLIGGSADQSQSLTLTQSFAIGGAARSMAACALMPFTVLKTRYESGLYSYTSVMAALGRMRREEGWRGLTSGTLPTLLRDVPFSATYLMTYTFLKNQVRDAQSQPEDSMPRAGVAPHASAVALNFACGLVAGFWACAITHPFDVVKTRQQVAQGRTPLGACVLSIWRLEGAAGFLTGLGPRLARRSLMAALSWTVFENLTDRR